MGRTLTRALRGLGTNRGAHVDTTAIRTAYERDGLVHLPGAFHADVAAELAARVRAAGQLADLRRANAFGPLATEVVRDAIGVVVGGSCPEPNDWGGALVTEPTIGRWRTPTGGWHLDYPVQGAPLVELRLKWFAHLEQVVHGGGAPVLIAGFHRLVAHWAAQTHLGDVGHSAAVRDSIFGTSPWFKVLFVTTQHRIEKRCWRQAPPPCETST